MTSVLSYMFKSFIYGGLLIQHLEQKGDNALPQSKRRLVSIVKTCMLRSNLYQQLATWDLANLISADAATVKIDTAWQVTHCLHL